MSDWPIKKEISNQQKDKKIKSKGGFILRVRQRCDEQYNYCVATIVFSSCCLVNLIKKQYNFRCQLLSNGSDKGKNNFNSAATASDDPCDENFR